MSKTNATVTLAQFAFKLGQMMRATKAASEPFAAHFVTLDADGRKAMRSEWIVSHLEGQGYSAEDATWINDASRKERAAEDQQAYDCARQHFKYHVERGAANQKAEEAVEIEIPEELIKAARKLAELANAYKDARKLANKALATAFATAK